MILPTDTTILTQAMTAVNDSVGPILATDSLHTDTVTTEYLHPQTSLLNQMINQVIIYGKEGTPLPYQMENDNGIMVAIICCFFLFTFLIAGGKNYIIQQLKSFIYPNRHSSLFAEESYLDLKYQCLFILNTCLTTSILLFQNLNITQTSATDTHSAKWLLLYAGIIFIYYIIKYIFYSFTNWIFFNKEQKKEWIKSYFFTFIFEGLLLFPVLLTTTYFEFSVTNKLIFIGIIFLLGKIMLFYKSSYIFFNKIYRAFYLIVYFCALEIVPCILLWTILIVISSL